MKPTSTIANHHLANTENASMEKILSPALATRVIPVAFATHKSTNVNQTHANMEVFAMISLMDINVYVKPERLERIAK